MMGPAVKMERSGPMEAAICVAREKAKTDSVAIPAPDLVADYLVTVRAAGRDVTWTETGRLSQIEPALKRLFGRGRFTVQAVK